MEFGLFMELSVPRPWSADSEREAYENALEQVRLADELGFDYVWAVEHHFLEEYSHSSAPDLFLTACAMQTKRIRVGHGVVACVPQYQSPIRIAERAGRPRHPLRRPGRARHRPLGHLDRARRVPRQCRRDEEDLGRVRPRHPEDVDAGAVQLAGPVLFDAGTGGAAEARAEAAPADVGRGHVSRTPSSTPPTAASGVSASRPAASPSRRRRSSRTGPSPELRSRRGLRQRQGLDDQLPLVRGGRRSGAPAGLRVASIFSYMASQLLSAKEVLPTRSYPSAGLLPGAAAGGRRARRRRAGLQRRHDGHARRHGGRDPQVGCGRLRRHQLLRELHGGAAAAVRARQHAHVRRARDAAVQGPALAGAARVAVGGN